LGEANIKAAPIMKKFNIPGMIILQMTFKDKEKPSPVSENMVVYTGTHDNDTIVGRFNSMNSNGHPVQSELELKPERDRALAFFNSDGSNIHWDFIKLALDSEARMAIIPLQDILGLGTESRMNIPGTVGNNWEWRYSENLLLPEIMEKMRLLTENSGRI
nr:4-alpha-glucanotransferase [Candidatus Neomarinimicrobiota bacterium]